jgi:hypothetical protein
MPKVIRDADLLGHWHTAAYSQLKMLCKDSRTDASCGLIDSPQMATSESPYFDAVFTCRSCLSWLWRQSELTRPDRIEPRNPMLTMRPPRVPPRDGGRRMSRRLTDNLGCKTSILLVYAAGDHTHTYIYCLVRSSVAKMTNSSGSLRTKQIETRKP